MPVASFAPNAYGLHDTIGNVWEFCLDGYKVEYHKFERRAGDGLVLADGGGDVARRGTSSTSVPPASRVFARGDRRFYGRDALTGVRPARALRPR